MYVTVRTVTYNGVDVICVVALQTLDALASRQGGVMDWSNDGRADEEALDG